MSALDVRGFAVRAPVPADTPTQGPRAELDAHPSIRELEILQAGVELTGPEAAAALQPAMRSFQGELTNGDELRLGPPPRRLEGGRLNEALRRVLTTPRAQQLRAERGDDAESRMLRVALGYAQTLFDIYRLASGEARKDG